METLTYVMTSTFFPPYHVGGDAIHVQQLSQELVKLGHEVHVIHSIDAYSLKRREPLQETCSTTGVIVHPIKSPLGWMSPLISYLAGSPYPVTKKIIKVVQELRPDVIHHHNISLFGPSIFAAQAPVTLYTAHDYWLVCPRSSLLRYDASICCGPGSCGICSLLSGRPPQLWRYTRMLGKKMENIDTIITPSNYMKRIFEKNRIKGDLAVIPNFVPEWPQSSAASRVHESPYFLFVGVLERHKGVMDLIEAFLEVYRSIEADLLIIGRGSMENEIRTKIEKSGCAKRILLLGYVDNRELTNVYRQALALIIPSTCHENSPLVALEALSNGTPLIVSKQGGLPEIVSNSNLGVVFTNRLDLQRILKTYRKDVFDPRIIKDAYHSNHSPRQYIRSLFMYVEQGRQRASIR